MNTSFTQEEIYQDIFKTILNVYTEDMITEDSKKTLREASKQYYTFYSEFNKLMNDKIYIFDNNINNSSKDVIIGCNRIGYMKDEKLSLHLSFVSPHDIKGSIKFLNDKLTVNFESLYLSSSFTEILKKHVWMNLYPIIYNNKEKTDFMMEKNTIILNTVRILKTYSIDSELIKPKFIDNQNKSEPNKKIPIRHSSLDFYHEFLKLKDVILLASDINIEKDLERLKQLINIKKNNRLSND